MTRNPPFVTLARASTPDGTATRLRHQASGARVLTVDSATAEPVFSITFPIALEDDRGTAHVLEHLVFRGSHRFPADQLHAGLITGTLCSIVNASTRPDLATYHLASPDAHDLSHATEVLLDALFDPLLADHAFAAEAWHPTPQGPAGVIMSEMRGAMANPEFTAALALRHALLPDLPWRWNQGGDPEALPLLGPADVRAFHRRFHHPANALVVIWGTDGMDAQLDLLDRALTDAAMRHPGDLPCPVPPPLLRWHSPRQLHLHHPAGAHATRAVVLPDGTDPVLAHVLDTLVGVALRGLDGLTRGPATGLLTHQRETILALTCAGPDAAASLDLAMHHLHRLSCDIPPDLLHATLIQAGLGWCDEDAFPRRPAGLHRIDRLIGPWRHGADPLQLLDMPAQLARLAGQPQALVARLQSLLRTGLIENPHRLDLTLQPGPITGTRRPPAAGQPPITPAARPLQLPGRTHLPERLPMPTPGTDGLARLALALRIDGLAPIDRLHGLLRDLRAALQADPVLGTLTRGLQLTPSAHDDQIHLMLGLACRPGDLAATLDALRDRLEKPLPVAPDDRPGLRARLQRLPQTLIELRLRAHLSPAHAAIDRLAGPGALLIPADDRDANDRLLRHALVAPRIRMACTGGDASLVDAFIAHWPDAAPPAPSRERFHLPDQGTGFALDMPLGSAGVGFDLSGGPDPAACRIALKIIETERLWPEIRVRGGAYGLRTGMDDTGAAAAFSARDPHLRQTLQTIRDSGTWLARHLDQAMLDRGRIGAAAGVLAPLSPMAQLMRDLQDDLAGGTAGAMRQDIWQNLRQISLHDLRRTADAMIPRLHAGLATALATPEVLATIPGLVSPASDP